MPRIGWCWLRDSAPEIVLAVACGLSFLTFLGRMDLWGRREQRIAQAAADTIQNGHWLIARLQDRLRLEKPPLPQWIIAAAMGLSGRHDELIVRLPGAGVAILIVWLTYFLGRQIGGRSVGVTAGLMLCTMVFFVEELRQAGNDSFLVLFTTLALTALWQILRPEASGTPWPCRTAWLAIAYGSIGLGLLSKGPVIIAMVAITLAGYVRMVPAARRSARSAVSGWGALLALVIGLSWPVVVGLRVPRALAVWYQEIMQKATPIVEHSRERFPFFVHWVPFCFPWVAPGIAVLALPWLPAARAARSRLWFVWWWMAGNLAMLCVWTVPKPSYYLPCLPAVAIAMAWVWDLALNQTAKPGARPPRDALWLVRLQWTALAAAAAVGIVLTARRAPGWTPVVAGLGLGWILGVAASIAWVRRGRPFPALAALVAPQVAAIVILYGWILPSFNPQYSHRAFDAAIERTLGSDPAPVAYYDEINEGIWFYLDRPLVPLTGGVALYEWLKNPGQGPDYLVLRIPIYEKIKPDLAAETDVVATESALGRRGGHILVRRRPGPSLAGRSSLPAAVR